MEPCIALCHEWVTTWGGSERVSKRIADILDINDIYTFAGDPNLTNDVFGDRVVRTSRIGTTRVALRHWQWFLPIMPLWWRHLDLDAYDVVVTCSHSSVNSIKVSPEAAHISYCCTPMRYAWSWQSELGRVPAAFRPLWPLVATYLRSADRRRSRSVDLYLADSRNVAGLIERFYGRRAMVLYPPVDTEYFTPQPAVPRENFFLIAGRLVPYKRPDLAVRAANQLRVPLVVAGSGPELPRLVEMAGPTIEFRTHASNDDLRDLYRRARALLLPGIEDFGIIPVEAQSCGTPVIALAAGGALETVRDRETGVLYSDPSLEGLVAAMRTFDPLSLDAGVIRKQAERFGSHRFDVKLRTIVTALAGTGPTQRAALIQNMLMESGWT